MRTQHKETLTSVPNALDGRDGVDKEIIGMKGIPDDAFDDGTKY